MSSHKKFTILMTAVLLLFTIITASPKIEFSSTEYNFGRLNQGEKADYDYKFENTGDDTLKIDKVKSSCGCTATMLSKKCNSWKV